MFLKIPFLRLVRSRYMSCSLKNDLNGERRLGYHNLPAGTRLVGVRQAMVIEIAGSSAIVKW